MADDPSNLKPAPAPGDAPPVRPDYVPEKFWDGEKGEVRTEAALKAYGDLEKKLSGGKGVDALTAEITTKVKADFDAERAKARPPKAEDYKLEIPDGTIPEGVEFRFDETHPLVGWWRNACFEQGLGQDKFAEGVKLFVDGELAKLATSSAALEAEFKKLGDNGKARIDFIAGRIGEIAGSSATEVLAPFLTTAAAVEAMEKLLEATGGPKFSAIHKAENSDAAVTPEKLREMQRDPKYWRDKDPEFIKQVTEGWRRIAPGEHRGGFQG